MIAADNGEEGRPAEKPVDPDMPQTCVQMQRIDHTHIIDDRNILFYMHGKKIYHNQLPHRCAGLKIAGTFMYRTSLNSLCNVDIITVLRQSGGGFSPGPSCGLGMFKPVTARRGGTAKGQKSRSGSRERGRRNRIVGLDAGLDNRAPIWSDSGMNNKTSDDQESTVLITGANRGIGFEFVRQYAAKGWYVIATARNPEGAQDLKALAEEYPRVTIEELDVSDLESIDALAERLSGQAIDLLVNNAGFFGEFGDQAFGGLELGQFDQFMRTNARGPLKMSEAFLPHLKAGRQKKISCLDHIAGPVLSGWTAVACPGCIFINRARPAFEHDHA